VRTKFVPVGPKSHDERTIRGARLRRPRRGTSSARTHRRFIGPTRRRARASTVEDVVGGEVDERHAELCDAACRRLPAAALVSSSAPSTLSGRRVKHKLQFATWVGGAGCVTPSLTASAGASGTGRERRPELRRVQDAVWSRSESSGDRVLQRSTTRGSFHGTPCSPAVRRTPGAKYRTAVGERLVPCAWWPDRGDSCRRVSSVNVSPVSRFRTTRGPSLGRRRGRPGCVRKWRRG
jgi:hypothetical protein